MRPGKQRKKNREACDHQDEMEAKIEVQRENEAEVEHQVRGGTEISSAGDMLDFL
jgi:hypothetical protein